MPILDRMSADGSKPVLIWTHDIEDTARAQLRNIAALPFIHHHVAAMPEDA